MAIRIQPRIAVTPLTNTEKLSSNLTDTSHTVKGEWFRQDIESTGATALYRSNTCGKPKSLCVAKLLFTGIPSLTIRIKSYAESSYDYTIISQINSTKIPTSYNSGSQYVLDHTSGRQNTWRSITLTTPSTSLKDICWVYIVYTKDASVDSDDDCGWFEILSSQVSDYLIVDGLPSVTTFVSSGAAKNIHRVFAGKTDIYEIYDGNNEKPIYHNDSDYFSFTNVGTAVASIKLNKSGTITSPSLQSSYDKESWTTFTPGSTTISLAVGETVYFRNTTTTSALASTFATSTSNYHTWSITGTNARVAAGGNICSLVANENYWANYDNTRRQLPDPYGVWTYYAGFGFAEYCFYKFFYNCTALTRPPRIGSHSDVPQYCFAYMFYGCTNLEYAPALPAMNVGNYAYQYMFRGCTSLRGIPELPAITVGTYAYRFMFYGTNLRITTSYVSGYQWSKTRFPVSDRYNVGNTKTVNMYSAGSNWNSSMFSTGTVTGAVSAPNTNTSYYIYYIGTVGKLAITGACRTQPLLKPEIYMANLASGACPKNWRTLENDHTYVNIYNPNYQEVTITLNDGGFFLMQGPMMQRENFKYRSDSDLNNARYSTVTWPITLRGRSITEFIINGVNEVTNATLKAKCILPNDSSGKYGAGFFVESTFAEKSDSKIS